MHFTVIKDKMASCINYALFTYINNSKHNYYPLLTQSQGTSEGESQENA